MGCMAGKEQCNLWVMGEWGAGLESWARAPELQGDRKSLGWFLVLDETQCRRSVAMSFFSSAGGAYGVGVAEGFP